MKPEDIRRLYEAEDPATDAEAAQTMRDAATDPDVARQIMQVILALAPQDRAFESLLRHVLDSVIIDILMNRMQQDDEFALVISQRVLRLMAAMKPVHRAGRYRKGKTA